MATNGDISMISPPTSSISNDQDPFGQLPPLPPPLRSTQVLQPLSVFPGAETIKLHLYSCNCSTVYSLLCLPYLFSSIYCSIERSSNCTIVTSFVFVLLSPLHLSALSSCVFPSRFYCHFISMCSSLILFALFAVVFYTVSYVYVLIWTQSQLHATAHETFRFWFIHPPTNTHTQTLALSLSVSLTHTLRTRSFVTFV